MAKKVVKQSSLTMLIGEQLNWGQDFVWHWVDDLRRPAVVPPRFLKWLICLLAGSILLSGWAAVFHQVHTEEAAADAAAVRTARNRVTTLEQYVARTIESADLVTRHVADKYLIDELGAEEQTGRVPLVIRDAIVPPDFGPISVVDAHGDLVATSVPAAARPRNVRDHPVFRAHSAAMPSLLISPPARSRILGGTYVYVTRRVLNPDRSVRGFVGVQLRPDQLINFTHDLPLQKTDVISVIGLDGITRARREGNRFSSGEDLRGKLVMRMQAQKPNGTYVGPSSLDGHVRYFSHRRLKNYPIFATAGVSRDRTLAPVWARARLYFISMAVFTLLILLTAALVLISMHQRQARARALAIANERLRKSQRIAKIGDWECDLQTLSLLWSDQLCEMYEREPARDRLSSEEFLAYLDDEGRKSVLCGVELAVRTGEPQTYQYKAHLPSGTISHRSVIAVPVRDSSGNVTRLLGTDQDVSSEAELRSLQEKVAHLSRLDAMNTMAATLAHELNQPLTAASNYLAGSERLVDRHDPPVQPQIAEAITSAKRQVRLAGEIIRRVREMLGTHRRPIEPTSISHALDEAVRLLSATGTCAVGFVKRSVRRQAKLAWIDDVQLQQVLVNLIRNACEAAASNERPQVNVVVKPSLVIGEIVVSVSDNGTGIDQPLESLFSPFESRKETGLGLGLSISRTIIEYHAGKIWVEETGPTGTTISFSLRSALPQDAQRSQAAVN
jgi:C4-dicarboxylate-specific signal transduction histidine kinase